MFKDFKNLVLSLFVFFNMQGGKPDFFILGFPKCGTTSLFFYLKEHPQIIDKGKEIQGLNTIHKSRKHRLEYEKKFHDLGKGYLNFSANPFDIFVDPKIVKKYYPNSKLIIMVRNPVNRFFSHYQMNKIVHKKDENLQSYISIAKNSKSSEPFFQFRHTLLGMGFYEKAMRPWFDVFDQSKILVLVFEEFFANPSEHMPLIFKFLGIKDYKNIEYSNYSKLWYHYDDKLGFDYQNTLSKYYYKANLDLENLLGKKLNWNKFSFLDS